MNEGIHLMLLSQVAQAKLGVVKDVRDGTITMKGYDGQQVEVVRLTQLGLLMIRFLDNIDDCIMPEKRPYRCGALRALVIIALMGFKASFTQPVNSRISGGSGSSLSITEMTQKLAIIKFNVNE